MKITKLTFKNFMGYKNLNLPKNNESLPNGLILISGKNSYGKSSILQGILLAFFGPKVFPNRNAESFITYGEEKSELYVHFVLDNVQYYIYRKWGRSGSATSKFFEWDAKIKNYREIKKVNIENFFEISRDQALNTVFIRQGEVEELANKKGAELREMIIDLFRLDIIDDALKHLEIEMKSKNYEKEKLEKNRVPIQRIEEDIKRLNDEKENYKSNIDEKKKKIKDLEVELNHLPSQDLISELQDLYKIRDINKEKYNSYNTDFKAKINKLNLNIENFSTLDKINDKIDALNNSKVKIEASKKSSEEKKNAITKGFGKTKGRIEDINNKINLMERSLKFIESKGGKKIALCPTCQSELTQEHYDEVIQKFKNDIETNQKKIKDINKVLQSQEKEVNSNQKKLDDVKKEIAFIQALKDDFENYKLAEKKSIEVEKKLNDFLKKYKKIFRDTSLEGIKKLSLDIVKLNENLISNQKELNQKEEDIKVNDKRISDLRDEILRMKELGKRIGDMEIDIEHISKAKELVRRFVTEYMVVKRLVKNITLKTDKYIKDFTSGQYSDLDLDLSGTRKTGLSLKIKDNFNGEFESIEVLSGGDRTALGMALRLAVSELMSIIRPTKDSPKKNPKIDFLLLDEPLAALDETRRERILKHLTKSKTFSQVFLITHTVIPPEIQTHKIIVDKDLSTGISSARFDKLSLFF
ncbi:MAG: ATP-binding protein [Candidatus Hermodarchaeota archaeon]